MERFWYDVRSAWRQLTAAKGVTIAAVACIAVGIGANTAIFSLVNAVLLRPIPGVDEPERLVEVGRQARGGGFDTLTWPVFEDLREAMRGQILDDVAGWTFSPVALGEADGAPGVVLGMAVTPGYFPVLGLRPARGRFFSEDEAHGVGAASLAVVSHALWQGRFAGDPDIVGRVVRVNGTPATVVGVAPAGFHGHLSVVPVDVWVPIGMEAPGLPPRRDLQDSRARFLLGIGRVLDGVPVDAASEAAAATYARVVARYEGMGEERGGIVPLHRLPSAIHDAVALFMGVLMVIVGLVLLIACVNVAGILLARGTGRAREIAVRRALGAGRARLVQQLLIESLMLFALGGAAGLLLSTWATRLLAAFEPPLPPPYAFTFDLGLDLRVLGFTVAATLLTGLLFGLGPALRASRPELVTAIKDDVAGGTAARTRTRSMLVVGQMAMTLLLLIGSGLFLRALVDARQVRLGFDPEHVLTTSFDLQLHGYDRDSGRDLVRRLRERMVAHPAVETASASTLLPLGLPSSISYGGVVVEGFEPPHGGSAFPADLNLVTPDYFRTLGIPLLEGRDFDDRDVEGAPRVAVINETMARRFWPAGDAVGQRFHLGGYRDAPVQVVGVVADVKYATLYEETPMFTYLPLQQFWRSELSLQVRTRPGEHLGLAALRAAFDELDPHLPVIEVVPLRDYVDVGLLPQRLAGTVAGVLGLAGMLLAAIGVYGVTAYRVAQRRHEIGVRMALGAGRREVLALVLRQGMLAPAVGIVLGLALAAVLTRFLADLLFGVGTMDLLAFAGCSVLLAAVALLANLLPARSAATVDPMVTLRGS